MIYEKEVSVQLKRIADILSFWSWTVIAYLIISLLRSLS